MCKKRLFAQESKLYYIRTEPVWSLMELNPNVSKGSGNYFELMASVENIVYFEGQCSWTNHFWNPRYGKIKKIVKTEHSTFFLTETGNLFVLGTPLFPTNQNVEPVTEAPKYCPKLANIVEDICPVDKNSLIFQTNRRSGKYDIIRFYKYGGNKYTEKITATKKYTGFIPLGFDNITIALGNGFQQKKVFIAKFSNPEYFDSNTAREVDTLNDGEEIHCYDSCYLKYAPGKCKLEYSKINSSALKLDEKKQKIFSKPIRQVVCGNNFWGVLFSDSSLQVFDLKFFYFKKISAVVSEIEAYGNCLYVLQRGIVRKYDFTNLGPKISRKDFCDALIFCQS